MVGECGVAGQVCAVRALLNEARIGDAKAFELVEY